jgi:hypothetical protein
VVQIATRHRTKGSSLKVLDLGSRPRRHAAGGTVVVFTIVLALGLGQSTPRIGLAQPGASGSAPSYALPEPIYWKQTLFQIPYQWSSASEPGAVQIVCLHLSKDRGASWQKISEAKPNVSSFNYRAEGDGEYWFAVRTVDHQNRTWPAGEFQPELRVIVDTTMPRIDALQAELNNTGTVEIAWRGFDANLDPSSWKFESQSDPNGPWQSVPLTGFVAGNGEEFGITTGEQATGRAAWQLSAGQRPIAVRATVLDRAGNSATFRSEVRQATGTTGVVRRLPAVAPVPLANNQPANNPFVSTPTSSPTEDSGGSSAPMPDAGWISGSNSASVSTVPTTQQADQPWPTNTMAHAPFRLWSRSNTAPGDNVTSYGTPAGVESLQANQSDALEESRSTGVSAKYATANDSMSRTASPPFQPLQPYRQASDARPRAAEASASPRGSETDQVQSTHDSIGLPPSDGYANQQSNDQNSKLIGSRTFALEYDLEEGQWGVSEVELWGTRDNGKSWRMFAKDDDHRSPLVVTVDDEGRYGFRIVVQSAGGSEAARPRPGDAPELHVTVDLRQPVAELTAIERGPGNAADQLILHWRAEDDNLDARPVSLYYSSRPSPPWSAVATNLQNTGQYSWRVERHVPERFYLRLEVRDAAGNLAAFETREPIEFTQSAPSARLNSAESIGPTTTGAGVSYR